MKKHILKLFGSHKHRIKHLKTLIIIVISVGLMAVGLIALWLATLPIPDLSAFDTRIVSESTKIYDRTGQVLLYDIHEDAKRTVISFANISTNVKNATLAIEDAEFYNHIGIQPRSILRAILADLTPGGMTQGGSTITQQVIKKTILTDEQTIPRKLKEWVLALKIEKVLTKDQIFATYLNEIPYGGNVYGIEEASKIFFGKPAKDVTLGEAAYLAALPQAPSFYSPYGKNKAALDARQKLVLRKMNEYKFITETEYKSALVEKVTFLEKNTQGIRAPHFSLYIRDRLIQKYGEDKVLSGGLKVTSTLNYDMQEKAEETVKSFAAIMESDFHASNTAIVAIDPKTGDVLTMVGSRDYFDKKIDGNFNIATARRQPGSAFKPFVYAAGFNKGYTAETVLFDVKTEFSTSCNPDGTPKNKNAPAGTCYSPNNYDNLFEGPLTVRKALAESRNIPAVKMLYLVGIRDAIRTAEAMGIEGLNDPNRYGLTLVLGGGEVSLIDLTSAYGVFANDGVRNPYRTVLKVEDSKGNILEQAENNSSQVLPQNSARLISDILSDKNVQMASIKSLLNPIGRQIALKTGTTNDYRDVWAVGYTPDIVIGAWAGKNDNTPMSKKLSGLIIAPVWAAFMSKIAPSVPNNFFPQPEPMAQDLKPVLRGIWKGGQSYFIDSTSGKLATKLTPPQTRQEVIQNSVHDILHWVDKDNPNGPIPSQPGNDGQFVSWEYGVRNWFTAWQKSNPGFVEGGTFVPPTQQDDTHTVANIPVVSITSPNPSQVFGKNDRIKVTFNASVKFPIKKAELYINNTYIGSTETAPYEFNFTPEDVDRIQTSNTLRVIVYDSVFNVGEATSTLSIQ